jgi:TrpR family trp operon transcriptional repressor
MQDTKTLNEFFDLLLTLSEKEELTNRLLIINELLQRGKTQREIAAHLKVSLANVSRGSNALKTTNSNLTKLLLKIEE